MDVITLDETRLREAVSLLADGIEEIPLYQWLLGEHIGERDKREWLAELLMRPLLRVGCAAGAVDGDRLVGLVVWRPPDLDLSPDGVPPLTPEDVEVAVRTPGLRERLLELWTSPPLPPPAPDAVNLMFAAAVPDVRGGDTIGRITQPIEKYCRERELPFYAWTGSPRLRDWFQLGWNTTLFGTTVWNGVTMYGVVSDRPPVPGQVRPLGRTRGRSAEPSDGPRAVPGCSADPDRSR